MPRGRQEIEGFAEDLGKLLGSARAKADSWLGQRQMIVKNLEEVRDTATELLQQLRLGHRAAAAGRRGRRAATAVIAQVRRDLAGRRAQERRSVRCPQRQGRESPRRRRRGGQSRRLRRRRSSVCWRRSENDSRGNREDRIPSRTPHITHPHRIEASSSTIGLQFHLGAPEDPVREYPFATRWRAPL
jgi:hypothetical protein